MPVHEEVLLAARRICLHRGEWVFRVGEIVSALPYLNSRTVRTHVVSRCCVNAPKNHPHKWNYFRRVGRGTYSILPAYRTKPRGRALESASMAAEPKSTYPDKGEFLHPRIHAVIHEEKDIYVAECLEIAVVTQGRTMDEVIFNLREAIALHLDGEDLGSLGLSQNPRVFVTCELSLENAPAA
jgi:predicted RNase H-like HicB family nuclease